VGRRGYRRNSGGKKARRPKKASQSDPAEPITKLQRPKSVHNEEIPMSFIREENGVTAIEYGLIAALIAIAIIVALTALGDALSSNFDKVSSNMNNAI
jgi:pilus assembly protein Flp/PilA